jgi:pilus assembly protein CpaB
MRIRPEEFPVKRTGALVCTTSAVVSVVLGYLYTQRLEAEVSGGPRISVLVAASDIPVATTLTEGLLAVRDLPTAYVESRHIRASDLKKVIGQRITDGLKANEALLSTDVAKFSERKQLSGLIANGMRALSIDGRAADFDGLLRPGDRVDILLSIGSNDLGGSTLTLLQNILVLSVGGTTERNDPNARTYSRGATVTVSSTLEQAQILTEALRRGKLTLTLRNTDDITLVEGITETSGKDLSGRNGQVTRAASPATTNPTIVTKGHPEHVR